MPKISIIVPVYNVEQYLDRCLKSLINQTFKDIEIVVVDDGSPDNSECIYKKYAAMDTRVKYIRKENEGVSEARNTGMQIATGDFFIFVDSDDWSDLNACEVLYNEYLKTKADLILADAIVITDGKPVRNHVFKESFTTSDPNFFKAYQKACIGYCYNPFPDKKWNIPGLGSPWNKLFRKKIIMDNGLKFDPYVKGIYDDNLFTLHYLMHIKSMSYVKEPVYNFCIVSESLTQVYKPNTLEINKCIFERIEEFMEENESVDEFKDAYYVYVIRRLSKSLNVYFFTQKNHKTLHDKCAELRRVIHSEPYYSAIKKVDKDILLKNHMVVCLLARLNLPLVIWLLVNIKNKTKKLRAVVQKI